MDDTLWWGCDLGTTNVAIGRVDAQGSGETFFLSFDPALHPYEIHKLIKDFLAGVGFNPGDHLFIESVFMGLNQRTFARMVRVAHSVSVAASELGVVTEYLDNNQWRNLIFGTSRVKKEACQEWAMENWGELRNFPKKTRGHRADSLCLAHAGYLMDRRSPLEYNQHRRRGPDEPGGSQGVS